MVILLLALVVMGYFFVQWTQHGKQSIPALESAALSVRVISPERYTLQEHLKVTGYTVPQDEVVVTTELTGLRIQTLWADVGARVQKGDKLAVFDAESLRNELTQAQSRLERARDEFARLDAVKNAGAVTQESLIQKRAALKESQAQLDEAQLRLQRSTVKSPVDGFIFERKAVLGALCDPSTPLFRIARQSAVEIEANVPEFQWPKLKLNQKADVLFSGHPIAVSAHIRLIAPYVDPATRTVLIQLALEQPIELPVGLFGHVDIALGAVSGPLLPTTAVQEDPAGLFVWQVDGQSLVTRLPVQISLRSEEGVLVESVPAGAVIIERAGAFVKEGERVNVVKGS